MYSCAPEGRAGRPRRSVTVWHRAGREVSRALPGGPEWPRGGPCYSSYAAVDAYLAVMVMQIHIALRVPLLTARNDGAGNGRLGRISTDAGQADRKANDSALRSVENLHSAVWRISPAREGVGGPDHDPHRAMYLCNVDRPTSSRLAAARILPAS